jgi:hypothetical protein
MTPELFEQIEKIFYHARQVKADERAVFLAAICAGKDELRQEVEQLLDSSDGTDHGVFKLWNLEQSDYRAQFAVSVIIESEAAANTTLVAREGLALLPMATRFSPLTNG